VDFLQNIVAQRPGFLRPHVMVFSTPGTATTMLVGRIEKRAWRFWLRPQTTAGQSVAVLVVPEGGVIGAESVVACEHVVREVGCALRRGEFDLALFGGLEKGTPLHDAVCSGPAFFCRDHGVKHETHWHGRLPGTLDEFLCRISSQHRSVFRRKQRKLESAFPGQIHFRTFTQPGEVEDLAAAAAEVALQTYQYRRGGGYRPSQEGKSFLELAARNQWLRGYVLYAGKLPIAFWIGTLYQSSFRLDTTGYLQDYKDFDPGIILFLHMVDDLCKQRVKQLDFGSGESPYKARFGDTKLEMAIACMFAPTVKSVMLMTAKCLRYSLENTGRHIASRIGLEHPLRKIWHHLPSALQMKQSLELTLVCLMLIFLGTWQRWLKWPEGALLTAALCVLTSLEIVHRLRTPQTPEHGATRPDRVWSAS